MEKLKKLRFKSINTGHQSARFIGNNFLIKGIKIFCNLENLEYPIQNVTETNA